MSYDEDEVLDDGFRMSGGDDDLDEPLEPLDVPEEIEDDPEDRYH